MTAETVAEVDLSRPAPERLKVYLTLAAVGGLPPMICVLGVGFGILEPNRTVDVTANIFNVIPMILLPVAVFVLTKPGIERSSDLTLVWLPFTAAAQLTFELAWLVGQLFDIWDAGTDPGWEWMWWQFALTDTRYFGENPYIFGMELTAVVAATVVLLAWRRLIRSDLDDRGRLVNMWLAGTALAVLTANTLTYFASSLRNGLADVGQGDYGLVKFFLLNGPYLVAPVLVLVAMWRVIDHLYSKLASESS